VFNNLLLSAFPSLINEAPLRSSLISQFSELGGNTKATLVAFADPQNRDVLNQIKFLHRAVSLLQVCFFYVKMQEPGCVILRFVFERILWLSHHFTPLIYSLFCM
jgi:hypothetical protein